LIGDKKWDDPSVTEESLKSKILNDALTKADYELWFDGGTSCNSPKKGYGQAYGSYAIIDLSIGKEIARCERIQFKHGSNNYAEAEACRWGLEGLVNIPFIRPSIKLRI